MFMKDEARNRLANQVYKTGLYRLIPFRLPYQGVILMLHRVVEFDVQRYAKETSKLFISKKRLAESIEYFLKREYEIVGLDALYDRIKKGGREKKRFVCYTFDDGYKDTYEIAYPVFKKHGLPFAIYITTSFLEKTYVCWPLGLGEVIAGNSSIWIPLGDKVKSVSIQDESEKEKVLTDLFARINNLEKSDKDETIQELFDLNDFDIIGYSASLGMSWENIYDLSADTLVTVGAHTVNHHELARLSKQEVIEEVLRSKLVISQKIKKNVDHFAYPFGCAPAVTTREFEIVKEMEFKTCVTSRSGYIFAALSDYLERLPRVRLDNDTCLGAIDIGFRSAVDTLKRDVVGGIIY
jgi:peptidoglycan/xylan/chitin deacetylase (PgdA/CDA1 family)